MSFHTREVVSDRLAPYMDRMNSASQTVARRLEALKTFDPRLTSRTYSSAMHDYLVAAHKEIFVDDPSIQFVKVRGLETMRISDHTIVRFNKLDANLHGFDNHTYQTEIFFSPPVKQLVKQLELAGMPQEPTRIVVGYQLDRQGIDVDSNHIVRRVNEEILWDLILGESVKLDLDDYRTPAEEPSNEPRQRRITKRTNWNDEAVGEGTNDEREHQSGAEGDDVQFGDADTGS